MKIRQANEKDFEELLEIFFKNVEHHIELEKNIQKSQESKWDSFENIKNESSKELKEYLKDPEIKIFVAITEEKIVGFIMVSFLGRNTYVKSKGAEIDDLFVLEGYRGQGIGKMLVEKVLEVFRSKRIERVVLNVYSNNIQALKFYENLGFGESLKRLILRLE